MGVRESTSQNLDCPGSKSQSPFLGGYRPGHGGLVARHLSC